MSDQENSRPALFLDRDGIINVDRGYVHKKKDFEFINGIFELCRQAKAFGYWIFIITNQSGIGRGYYTERQFNDLSEWMEAKFREQNVTIDKVYFCPHHVEATIDKYKKDCQCRKPKPGMIFRANKDYKVDLPNSILLGDKLTDIQVGQKAGILTNILYDNDGTENFEMESIKNFISVIDLLEVNQYFKDYV